MGKFYKHAPQDCIFCTIVPPLRSPKALPPSGGGGSRGWGGKEVSTQSNPLLPLLGEVPAPAGDRVSKTPQPRLTPRQLPYKGSQGSLVMRPVGHPPTPLPPSNGGGGGLFSNGGGVARDWPWRGGSTSFRTPLGVRNLKVEIPRLTPTSRYALVPCFDKQ